MDQSRYASLLPYNFSWNNVSTEGNEGCIHLILPVVVEVCNLANVAPLVKLHEGLDHFFPLVFLLLELGPVSLENFLGHILVVAKVMAGSLINGSVAVNFPSPGLKLTDA